MQTNYPYRTRVDGTTTNHRSRGNRSVGRQLVSRVQSYLDPIAPRRFTRVGWWITGLLIAILIAPSLVAPFGNDEAIFYVAAQKILRGAVHYRDIIDIKPPLIYYLYAAAIALFGDHAISIRIFDLLLQGLTIVILCRMIRRYSGSDLRAAGAGVIYAIQYFAQSPGIQALPESYVGLLGLPIVWIALESRSPGRWLLAGALAGIAFLVKFTLGALVILPVLIELLVVRRSREGFVGRWGMLALGFLLMAGLLVLYLTVTGAGEEFVGMQQFMMGYRHLQATSTMLVVTNLLSALPVGATDYYTLLLMTATVAGGFMAMARTEDPAAAERRGVDLLRAALLASVVLLFTAIAEGKYAPFHIARLYPFGIILAVPPLLRLVRVVISSPRDRFLAVMLPIAAIALLLYSPLPRYGIHILRTYAFVHGGATAFDRVTNPAAEATSFEEMQWIGDYVVAHRVAGDRFFAATSSPGLVYRYARTVPEYAVLHAAFVKAPFAPARWRLGLRDALLRDRPRFIAAQTADRSPDLDGTGMTSLEMLRGLPGVSRMLDGEYRVVHRGKWYVMFVRN